MEDRGLRVRYRRQCLPGLVQFQCEHSVEVAKKSTLLLSRQSLRPKRWFRRRSRRQLDLDGFPQAEARRALRRDTVQRAISALSFEARVMILLRDFAKLSYDEIAEVVDLAPRKLVHALDRSRAELSEIYAYIKF